MGFSEGYRLFSGQLDKTPNADGTRNFKDKSGKVIAILNPKPAEAGKLDTHIADGNRTKM
jgi:hypothetical protein